MKSIDEQAISWLIIEKEGLTQIQKKELESWLEENPSHEKSYNTNKLLRQRFSSLSNSTKAKLIEKANQGAKKTRFIEKTKKFAIAASIFLCLGFGADYYFVPVYSQSFVSAQEPQSTLTLPDESKIVLDVHSNMNIKYYKSSRKVDFIDGRAVFYVAKDKEKPFIIKTKDAKIEVVGTAFEVSNINDSLSVKVKEGTVKVSFDKKVAYLNKSDEVFIGKNQEAKLVKTKLENIATWEKGFLLFDKTSLKDSLDEFSRYVDINIEYANQKVAQTQITGKFSIDDFDKFLFALPKIYSIKVERNQENLKFYKN